MVKHARAVSYLSIVLCLVFLFSPHFSSLKYQELNKTKGSFCEQNQDSFTRKNTALFTKTIDRLSNPRQSTAAVLMDGMVIGSANVIQFSEGKKIKVLTAWHVVSSFVGKPIQVGFLDSSLVYPMVIVKANRSWDIALLESIEPAKYTGHSIRIAKNAPKIGETIWVIGNPKGILGNVSKGIISNVLREEPKGPEFLRIDAAIFYGNSGGGVYNKSGDLIGIVLAVEILMENDKESKFIPGGGIALSSSSILEFLYSK